MKKIINSIKNISLKITIKKGKVILYFMGDSCNLLKKTKSELEIEEMIKSCKRTTPKVVDMKNKYKIKIINIDKKNSIAKEFNISSVPTFILLFNNKELMRANGEKTKKEIKDFINYENFYQKFLNNLNKKSKLM
jgi:hypothetical protein